MDASPEPAPTLVGSQTSEADALELMATYPEVIVPTDSTKVLTDDDEEPTFFALCLLPGRTLTFKPMHGDGSLGAVLHVKPDPFPLCHHDLNDLEISKRAPEVRDYPVLTQVAADKSLVVIFWAKDNVESIIARPDEALVLIHVQWLY